MFGLFARPSATQVLPDHLKAELQDLRGLMAAINKSRAAIEFSLDGTILTANENFLKVVGYTLDEIRGKHHRLFVDPAFAETPDYRAFWEKLGRGEYDAAQYKRYGKGGRELWLQAIYNPILGEDGRAYKVVKFANDITELKLRQADTDGQLAAINRSQAVIEFSLSGEVLTANANFCQALGYSLEEIKGKHHRLFVADDYAASEEYRRFWEKLGRGEFDAGQYCRLAKGGREVWIQASYNPIFDASNRPFKVVKYATDVTQQVRASRALELAVNETREVIAAAEEGNLANRIPTGDKEGAILELCSGVNGLLDMVADVIERIRISADAVNVATREISQGNADLSSRTEEQASSVEETASTMEELMSTVRTNSENAVKASQLARDAQQVAESGGQVVSEVVDTMSAIQQSSHRIADIIGVIDGIAFQTNILALNAAVEAARAGEQGRGFAVVATEVRNLAQRSANAAKEIKGLIADSSGKVQQGTRLVDKAGSTMRNIVQSIQTVADLMGGISGASQEQTSGIEQVGLAVNQMDEMTQQNAALVEQAAAAAESLEEQAKELVHIVGRFVQIGSAPATGAIPPRRSTAALQAPAARDKAVAARRASPPRQLAHKADEEWSEF